MNYAITPLALLLSAFAFSATAEPKFEGGQFGISGFTLHEHLYDDFFETYLVNDWFDEIEANIDVVYSFGSFGLQAGAHIGTVKWRSPSATPTTHYGTSLHGYYLSPNGHKFGAVYQFLDLGTSAPDGYNTNLVGLEALVGFGRVEMEASISTYKTFHSQSNFLATAHFYYPVSPQIEISAGYAYREFGALFPANQFSLGVEYSPENSRFDFNIDYLAERFEGLDYDLLQIGIRYRFGDGNTGRLFSDRTTGYGRFSI